MMRDELDDALRAYLRETPPLPDHLVRSALERVAGTNQRGRPWLEGGPSRAHRKLMGRGSMLVVGFRLTGAVALVALAVAVVLQVGPTRLTSNVSGPGSPSAQPGASEAAAPPSPSAAPTSSGRTIVVAQGGGGDARTIGEAVVMAEDGDTIVVRPEYSSLDEPWYQESGLMFRTDVTVRGGGLEPIEERIPGGPDPEVFVRGGDVTIEDVRLLSVGYDGGANNVEVYEGSLTFQDAILDSVGIYAYGGSVVIRESDLIEAGVVNGPAAIEDSNLFDSCVTVGEEGSLLVRRSTIIDAAGDEDPPYCAILTGGAGSIVESNAFEGSGLRLDPGATGSVVRDNRITGADVAIRVVGAADSRIEDNIIDASATGLELVDAAVIVARNAISGAGTGIAVAGSAADIRDNRITGNQRGVVVTGTTPAPALTGNVLCDNGTNLRVVGSGAISLEGNEVCPEASAEPPVATGTGPALTWERVEPGFELPHPEFDPGPRWVDGRFFATDEEHVLHASADGLAWDPVEGRMPGLDRGPGYGDTDLAWGDRRVQAREGSPTLTIVGPDGATSSHTFRGPIDAVTVSPAGIVVIENVRREHVIADVLGPEVADGDWRLVREDQIDDPTGTLRWAERIAWWVETPAGDLERIVLAEHGFGALGGDDSHSATLGWSSPDGVGWTPIRGAPLTYGDRLVGTTEGFWWNHGDDLPATLLFSVDGLTWERVGEVDGYRLMAWRDGVIVPGEGRIQVATTDGLTELPMSEVFGPGGALAGVETGGLQAGPLGLVIVDRGSRVIVYSPDGVAWSLADVPAGWEAGWRRSQQLAFGDDAVLIGLMRCSESPVGEGECAIDTGMWRGTVAP